jgi:predicted TIM-barrel fold metal-dependent hydrolase
VIDASLADIRRLVEMGVYVEHSICMFVEGSKFKFYDAPKLDQIIKAGTIERTILGSDLGQVDNPRLIDGFRSVIETVLDLGYTEAQVRKMVSTNAADLLGLQTA